MEKKVFLTPVETEIIICHPDKSLLLNELLIFPHGLDGLHIWEAGIILARWIYYNKELFSQKSVLELGTGVGIGGLSIAKFTNASKIVMSDYNQDVVSNVEKNILKNLKVSPLTCCQVISLDWSDYAKFNDRFDIIMGSDLIYSGSPVKELYQLIKRSLNPEGRAYIIIPSQRQYAVKFLDEIHQDNCFEYQIHKNIDQKYFLSPLKNEKEGFKTYPGLKELKFQLYELYFINKNIEKK